MKFSTVFQTLVICATLVHSIPIGTEGAELEQRTTKRGQNKCVECGKVFSSASDLLAHYRYDHDGQGKSASRSRKHRQSLELEARTTDSIDVLERLGSVGLEPTRGQNRCVEGGKVFSSASDLLAHYRYDHDGQGKSAKRRH
ncbi:hypothetical protein C8J56DRAFT_1164269 [Mycena floridula]|nr:hypothetical protein C8J56DRAFT_1164269 [Mycena floridula]